ncbi:hypothetical protein CHUAL_002643 [Chamberlinius hualienensis]
MRVETLVDLKDYYFDLAIFPVDCYICRGILGVTGCCGKLRTISGPADLLGDFHRYKNILERIDRFQRIFLSQSSTSEVFKIMILFGEINQRNHFEHKASSFKFLYALIYYMTSSISFQEQMWDRSTGKVQLVFKGRNQRITCLKTNPNKNIMIV